MLPFQCSWWRLSLTLTKKCSFGDLHLYPFIYPGSDNMNYIVSIGCKAMNILGAIELREGSVIENLLS